MTLRVQYTAQLRAAVGRTEEDVEMPAGCCLLELLVRLAACYSEVQTHLVTEAGQARPSLLVVVNETAVSTRHAASTPLYDGDVVMLLPPIAGG